MRQLVPVSSIKQKNVYESVEMCHKQHTKSPPPPKNPKITFPEIRRRNWRSFMIWSWKYVLCFFFSATSSTLFNLFPHTKIGTKIPWHRRINNNGRLIQSPQNPLLAVLPTYYKLTFSYNFFYTSQSIYKKFGLTPHDCEIQ